MKQADMNRRTAKHKLNGSYVCGAFIFSGLLGMLAQSWLVFLSAASILIANNIYEGSIRLK